MYPKVQMFIAGEWTDGTSGKSEDILNPATGPVNVILGKLGIQGPLWFQDPSWSKPSLVILGLWGVGNIMVIFLAAVLAFPASWKSRLTGLGLGILAIQVVNLVRVVALFLTGVYFPKIFDTSHTVIWQTIVILFGVMLWIFWANRFAVPPAEPAA